jgi:RHS repeat-associated protein
VKSNANPFTNAATTSANEFSAWVQAVPGANTLTVEAKDNSPNANTRTQSWSVNITGQSRTPSYDANGNQITGYILPLGSSSLVSCVYSWDAENRLVKITYADNSKTEFTYDGLSRRVRITERNASNTITSDKRYLWSGGNQPAEEREANGTTVTKRYFPQGEQRIGGSDAGFYYYTKDHLGSIREITNASGALATRYDFDLWGKRTKLSGSMETEVGFTGHHHHAKSGLVLTWYRVYDAESGFWLSPDPLGVSGGLNLYAYCYGNPLNLYDPDGMLPDWVPGSAGYPISEYLGDVGDVFVGQGKGAAEHLSFGLYKPCYNNDMQGAGGKIGSNLAMAGEIAATGGSAALKIAARRKLAGMTSKQIRNLKNADRKALDKALDGVVGDGLEAHHRAPLTGHSGSGQAAMFPSIGLPSWMKNSKWNGRLMTPSAHSARHAFDAGLERAAGFLGIGNVGVGAARSGLTATRDNCD